MYTRLLHCWINKFEPATIQLFTTLFVFPHQDQGRVHPVAAGSKQSLVPIQHDLALLETRDDSRVQLVALLLCSMIVFSGFRSKGQKPLLRDDRKVVDRSLMSNGYDVMALHWSPSSASSKRNEGF